MYFQALSASEVGGAVSSTARDVPMSEQPTLGTSSRESRASTSLSAEEKTARPALQSIRQGDLAFFVRTGALQLLHGANMKKHRNQLLYCLGFSCGCSYEHNFSPATSSTVKLPASQLRNLGAFCRLQRNSSTWQKYTKEIIYSGIYLCGLAGAFAGEQAVERDLPAAGSLAMQQRTPIRQARAPLRQDIGVPLEAVSNQTLGQIQKQLQGGLYTRYHRYQTQFHRNESCLYKKETVISTQTVVRDFL